jgi:predicted porin
MKKSLLALAALTAFAGVASAQSSVTLFGIVDVSVRNVKESSGSLKSLSTDGMGSSRLGFRGVEDIGGGLRAGFWIEGSLQADTGNAAGQNWQRRSTVSLMGGFGEIRLGRDYTPDFWNHTVFDPFGTNGVGSSVNVFDASGSGATTVVRANNSIGYFLPGGMGGVYGQVMLAAGEGAVGNKHTGLRVGYAAGPLNVAVALGKTGAVESCAPPTCATTVAAVDWSRLNIGASYNLGFMTAMVQYIKSDTSGGAADGRGLNNILLGANVPMGAGVFKFSYVKADGDGKTAAEKARDATQLALGYQYSLSKRTAVYGHYAKISNKSGANFTASGSGPAAAHAAGKGSNGYEFGVNHSF